MHRQSSIVNACVSLLEYAIYYRPQCIIGHSIFLTAKQISSSTYCSTDNSKSDYSKTKRIRFFLPWQEGLKCEFCIIGLLTDTDCHVEFGPPLKSFPGLNISKYLDRHENVSSSLFPHSKSMAHTMGFQWYVMLMLLRALVQAVLLEKLSLHVQSKG